MNFFGEFTFGSAALALVLTVLFYTTVQRAVTRIGPAIVDDMLRAKSNTEPIERRTK